MHEAEPGFVTVPSVLDFIWARRLRPYILRGVMDFGLSREQEELQAAIITFAQRELSEGTLARDAQGAFFREGWDKCAELGIQGLPVPAEYGGSGEGLTTTIAAMEALGYGCRDQGLLFSINASMWTNTIPILRYGTEEQKRRFLPGLCSGQLIGANCGSEPGSGSDIFSLQTRARKEGDSYVLDGGKTFVTNGPVADTMVTYATLNPQYGLMGICAFVIEKGTPGVVISGEIHKMGLRTSPMSQVTFEDCRVPSSARLGREGRGAEVFNCAMEWERGCILATALGAMRRQLETCLSHARSRKQFGKAIAEFQSVANRLADMRVRFETSRMLVYKIGWLKDQGKPAEMEAAMAKLHTSESFVQSSLDAMRTFGGYGFMTEYGLERELRDAVGGLFSSGTSDIQRNIIARKLGL